MGERWRHKRKGTVYVVDARPLIKAGTWQRGVTYRPADPNRAPVLWARTLVDFLDAFELHAVVEA